MAGRLADLGIHHYPSDANFVLFGRFPDRHRVWQQLLDRGVLIRETGPEGYLRASAGTPDEMAALRDALTDIAPTLEEKVDIVQNAIDLHHGLGLGTPLVAILSAVEQVTEKIPTTLEAAALCKMADRGQITGGVLDGPLALDNAISPEAARIKGIVSPVAGKAQILVAPDLEAGNMLAKNLTFLSGAQAAGIVMGARVPIILTSRADSAQTRMASCAVASIYAGYLERKVAVEAKHS